MVDATATPMTETNSTSKRDLAAGKRRGQKRLSARSPFVVALISFTCVSLLCNVWSLSRLYAQTEPADGVNEIHSLVNRYAQQSASSGRNATITRPAPAHPPTMQEQRSMINDESTAWRKEQQNAAAESTPKNWTKPKLILHLGPAKTATTTLQIDLRDLFENRRLQHDKYLFWGIGFLRSDYKRRTLRSFYSMWNKTCMHDEYADYLREKRRIRRENPDAPPFQFNAKGRKGPNPYYPPCAKFAMKIVAAMKEDNVSLILSNEMFSMTEYFEPGGLYRNPIFFEHFKDIWEGWDITVVVTYRRLAEWMLSSMKQFNMEDIRYGQEPCTKWPLDGGKMHNETWPKIKEWLAASAVSSETYNQQMTLAHTWVYLDGIIQTWKNAGFRVHVMNMHSKRQITKQLMCDFIPDAPESCAFLENRTEEPPRNVRNMAWFAYNDIVHTAAKRHVIPRPMQLARFKPKMTVKLAQYHEGVLNQTFADFPLLCPDETEVQQLLDASLAFERKWMPEWSATPGVEEAHRASFDKIAHKKREFCKVDMDRLFRGVKSWRGLFERLNQTWS